MPGNAALARLVAGNARYVAGIPERNLQDESQRQAVIAGQEPFAVILSCADSRVVPELIFDTGIGELFVVRVAGNIANTSSVASIEFAVASLGVRVVVVLGHQSCGAVTAAIAGGDHGPNLNHLVAHIQPAVEATTSGDVDDTVITNARMTAANLLARSQILRETPGLVVVPAWYLLEGGRVEYFD